MKTMTLITIAWQNTGLSSIWQGKHSNTMKAPRFLILPLTLLAMVSCTTITPETNTQAKFKQGVPGGTVVQTSTINATVTGIDAANHKVTLVTPEGKKFDVKTSPEAVNFKQVHVGDQFKATLTEEVVVTHGQQGRESRG